MSSSAVLAHTAAVLLGAGAAIIWLAAAAVLATNSSPASLQRNCGVFWATFHLSGLTGNLVVVALQSSRQLHSSARNLVAPALTSALTEIIVCRLRPSCSA